MYDLERINRSMNLNETARLLTLEITPRKRISSKAAMNHHIVISPKYYFFT